MIRVFTTLIMARATGSAFDAQIDDINGCGESAIAEKAGAHLTWRFGVMKLRITDFTRIGTEISHQNASPVPITHVR